MAEMQELVEGWIRLLGPNRYVQAAVTVLAFLLLAKLVQLLTGVVLRRAFRSLGSLWAERLISKAHRPLFITVTAIGLMIAVTLLGLGPTAEAVSLALLKTILVFVWVAFGLRASQVLLEAWGNRVPPPPFLQQSTAPLLRIVLSITAALIGAYAILLAWDVNVTGLVASAGILGLAVSFAAQDTLGNLVAGISILADKPYRLGDYIVLDTGERGQVTHVGLRSTRLLTRDDVEISIPNGIMGRAKIVNESGGPDVKYRLRVPVNVAYGSDIDQVMNLLLGLAAQHAGVCPEPEPRVRFRTFGDSSLSFELLAWIRDPAQRGVVLHDLNCEIYKAFRLAGVRIPFPQRDLHIRDWAGRPAAAVPGVAPPET